VGKVNSLLLERNVSGRVNIISRCLFYTMVILVFQNSKLVRFSLLSTSTLAYYLQARLVAYVIVECFG